MTPQEQRRRAHLGGMACGLGAALSFGASAPVAKLLLPFAPPLTMAALLYIGATLGLHLTQMVVRLAQRGAPPAAADTPLQRGDWPVLLATILSGGVAGPMFLMLGLGRVSGVTGSLLLNLEAPCTIAIAVLIFREHLGVRALGGAAAILAGAVALGAASALRSGGAGAAAHSSAAGVLLVAAACVSWAIDSNLSQKLSLRDPWQVVRIKTLASGAISLAIARAAGEAAPVWRMLPAILALGFVSYGLSIILYIRALRFIGAARQGAIFATAPFAGALLSVPVLRERIGAFDLLAGAAMAGGVALLSTDHHEHEHTHEALEHDHLHVHDAHHEHAHAWPHAPAGALEEPHAHPHTHAPLAHTHPHVSDDHHRHAHES